MTDRARITNTKRLRQAALISVAIASAVLFALASDGGFPTAAVLLRRAAHHVVVRVLLLAGWAWVGLALLRAHVSLKMIPTQLRCLAARRSGTLLA